MSDLEEELKRALATAGNPSEPGLEARLRAGAEAHHRRRARRVRAGFAVGAAAVIALVAARFGVHPRPAIAPGGEHAGAERGQHAGAERGEPDPILLSQLLRLSDLDDALAPRAHFTDAVTPLAPYRALAASEGRP